jgi:endogenous inhibitor of DNA gyrase (YacG/DUF329 family)
MMKPCPICKKQPIEQFIPFCSARCADVDLHRWMGGVYAIPVTDSDPDEENEVMSETQPVHYNRNKIH